MALAIATDKSGCYATGKNSNSGITSSCSTTTGTTSYTYDDAGNRTDLGATYYAGNRLALFNGGWYTYDADGNVSQKYGVKLTPRNQQFYWIPENRLAPGHGRKVMLGHTERAPARRRIL